MLEIPKSQPQFEKYLSQPQFEKYLLLFIEHFESSKKLYLLQFPLSKHCYSKPTHYYYSHLLHHFPSRYVE